MGLKQWRVVYEYKNGLVTGAGAAFAIAESEQAARVDVARLHPNTTIKSITEERRDPLAAYDVPVAVDVVRAENLPAAALEAEPVTSPNLEKVSNIDAGFALAIALADSELHRSDKRKTAEVLTNSAKRLLDLRDELATALEAAYLHHRRFVCPTDTTQQDHNWQINKGRECSCPAYHCVRAALAKAGER
jgi:hypothetical protein